MPIDIRNEVPADIPSIASVITEAFLGAARTSGTERFIVDALRARGRLTISLVAVDGGQIVGHVALSPVTISDGSTGWYGLGPLSVLPGQQGLGIGAALMHAALQALRRHGAAGCVVLGEPAYYGRFGFACRPGLVLDGVPPEYFQAVRFQGNWPDGTVQYDAAFNATA